MITLRSSSDRGHVNHGWLDTYHTFSFGDYYDPRFMGFRSLRVINDDRVAPGMGFGTHPHKDMEIITYVLDGALEHKDSMGNGSVIRPGDVQYMSAGTGVTHSEFNPSRTDPVHLLQIWIMPDQRGHAPRYGQKSIGNGELHNRLQLIASPDGQGDSIAIHQDARLWAVRLDPGSSVQHEIDPARHAWLHVARGTVNVNGNSLQSGDAAAFSDERQITIAADTSADTAAENAAEILLFDLA
jgi:redox-sensitive bicupin YhaK (pirin superfamily)